MTTPARRGDKDMDHQGYTRQERIELRYNRALALLGENQEAAELYSAKRLCVPMYILDEIEEQTALCAAMALSYGFDFDIDTVA
jgi:hypothetical protein